MNPPPVIIRRADLVETVEVLRLVSSLRGLDLTLIARAERLLDVWQAQIR